MSFTASGPGSAAALRLSDDGRVGTGSFTDRIVEVLAVRRQLLVLDNCEHVADEVAALVEAITETASGIDLLLTSREPLRVDGEHVLGVDPLGPEQAAVLLTDRIRAAHPGAEPEPDREELVAQLCRRLDGLPLALELAAARVPSLGLRGLLDALDRPFELLRGGRRTAQRCGQAPVPRGCSARTHAVERAAGAALGVAFETLQAEGATLGDSGAVALARQLTRACAG